MKIFKEVSLGFLTAIASSLVIIGAIVVSMTEGLSLVVPTLEPTLTLPAVVETAEAGIPTSTPRPQTATPRLVIITNAPRATPCPTPEGWVSLTFSQSDDIKAIAAARGVSVEDLKNANCTAGFGPGSKIAVPPFPTPTLTPSLTYTVTITLTLSPTISKTICPGPPANWVRYVVKPGDTLSSLAAATGTTYLDIQTKNCLTVTQINSGSVLYLPRLPGGTPTPTLRPTITRTTGPSRTSGPTRTTGPTRTNTPIPTNLPTVPPTGTNIATQTSTLTSTFTPGPTFTSTATVFTIVTATPRPTATPTPVTPGP
jgi:LysM repeat protein